MGNQFNQIDQTQDLINNKNNNNNNKNNINNTENTIQPRNLVDNYYNTVPNTKNNMTTNSNTNHLNNSNLNDSMPKETNSIEFNSNQGDHTQSNSQPQKIAKCPFVFKWPKNAKEVYVAGTFNNWECIPLNKSSDDFNTIIDLPPGKHEYKYLVDRVWLHDPEALTSADPFNGFNNIVDINPEEEFNINIDIFAENSCDSNKSKSSSSEYGQEIPNFSSLTANKFPPEFPRHLTKMPVLVLNSNEDKTPLTNDVNVLSEEPSHVCLNHLYAISLKDCTVLSTPFRYKDKYVTTLFYKPL